MEPAAGIEPATDGLQNRCSTAELSWQLKMVGAKRTHILEELKKQASLKQLRLKQMALQICGAMFALKFITGN